MEDNKNMKTEENKIELSSKDAQASDDAVKKPGDLHVPERKMPEIIEFVTVEKAEKKGASWDALSSQGTAWQKAQGDRETSYYADARNATYAGSGTDTGNATDAENGADMKHSARKGGPGGDDGSFKSKLRKLAKNKYFWVVTSIVLVAAVLFGVLFPIFRNSNKDNLDLYKNEEIMVVIKTADGDVQKTYKFSELAEISPLVEFSAVLKTSDMLTPINRKYKGIDLGDLLKKLVPDIENYAAILCHTSDGVIQQYSRKAVLNGNYYVASEVEGKPFNKGVDSLGYQKPQEDGGPFVVIPADEQFSQHRAKCLVKIVID